jgi:hypothetical protein
MQHALIFVWSLHFARIICSELRIGMWMSIFGTGWEETSCIFVIIRASPIAA